jgi:heme oxygenase
MSRLKELTWEHHKEAERQGFVKVILSGKIHPGFYATYLWNQHKKYDLLEALAGANGLLDDLPEVRRKNKIEQDYLELWPHAETPPVLPSVNKYIQHMKDKFDDPHALMAHVYVLHMGDLSGGQMIAKQIPGEGRLYQFDKDIDKLKEAILEKTDDSMANEARICFSFATKLFQDLMELDCERYLERTD